MECYVTRTASFLPGASIGNDDIQRYLGVLEGESEVKDRVLALNGIRARHYGQDDRQQATHDVYDLGTCAASRSLRDFDSNQISFLAAGTTYAPLAAPGIASILHDRLSRVCRLDQPLEISSHGGVCTSSAAALVGAIRAVQSGVHQAALAIGTEHASEVLKSTNIKPVDDRSQHPNVRNSRWFMSVFLRFMLSDGAGAMVLQNRPTAERLSLRVNWTHSLSFAHTAPLCMKLDNESRLLSQDVSILQSHLFPAAGKAVQSALDTNNDTLDRYKVILPHMSSFFFRRKMQRMIAEHGNQGGDPVPFWTNLASAGNTGSASIYIMLDEFLKQQSLSAGERILLFIPESGQFNFVLISLTACIA